MTDLYIRDSGRMLGPFDEETLRLRVADGELPHSTMSWRAGERRWISIGRRWKKTDRGQGLRVAASWGACIVLSALALVVSLRLVDLPRFLQGFAVSTTVIVLATILSFLVAGWYWRSSARTSGRPTLGVVLCALLVALGAVCSLSIIAFQKRVSDNRLSMKDATMVFDAATGELYINGNIADRFTDDLREALARAPGIRRIAIDSPGGFIEDALEAGRMLDERKVTVRVMEECASACVVFWSSAPAREITFEGRVGLHQSRVDVDMPSLWRKSISDEADVETTAVLKRAGFSDAMLDRQASTAASDMYWLDPVEMMESGVQLSIVDAHGTPLTASHAKFLSVASGLDARSSFRKLMEAYGARAPQLADKFGPDLYAAWHGNDADGMFRFAGALNDAAKSYAFGNAPDAAVVDWARSVHGLLGEAIASSDAASCSVLLGGTHAGDPADPVSDRMVLALADLVESVPEGKAPSIVSVGRSAVAETLARTVFRQKVAQGYPLRYEQWSNVQKCRFMDGVYAAVLQLPSSEAARAVRATEGF